MELDLSGYLATFSIGFKSQMAYKADAFLTIIHMIVKPLTMLFVWAAIYASSNASTIGGFSLTTTSYYFFLIPLVGLLNDESIALIIQKDVRQGNIASSLIKPLIYPFKVFFESLARTAVNIIFAFLPLFVIVALVVHITLTVQSLLFFALEIVVGFIAINLFTFLIGTVALRNTQIDGLYFAFWGIASILGGGLAPLNFFPQSAQNILALLPFQMFFYLPVATLLGTANMSALISGLIVTAIWIALLAALASISWRRVLRNVISAGG